MIYVAKEVFFVVSFVWNGSGYHQWVQLTYRNKAFSLNGPEKASTLLAFLAPLIWHAYKSNARYFTTHRIWCQHLQNTNPKAFYLALKHLFCGIIDNWLRSLRMKKTAVTMKKRVEWIQKLKLKLTSAMSPQCKTWNKKIGWSSSKWVYTGNFSIASPSIDPPFHMKTKKEQEQ